MIPTYDKVLSAIKKVLWELIKNTEMSEDPSGT